MQLLENPKEHKFWIKAKNQSADIANFLEEKKPNGKWCLLNDGAFYIKNDASGRKFCS